VSSAKGTAGTIGAFVRDAGGEIYLLSSADTLGGPDYEPGSEVIQPGGIDGGRTPTDVIGYFTKYLPLGSRAPVANLVGLARIKPGVAFETAIPDIGALRGVHDPRSGALVRMWGRTSKLATGKILLVDMSFTMPSPRPADKGAAVAFVNAIGASAMSKAGDGGALVVDEEGYAIGVVVADSETTTILAPIQQVLRSLGVQLCTMDTRCVTVAK
jgi:hypothetical protein